ncbi:uncharacterized protein LOC114711581 [Neltuma alba]|uniref:uncharacterized protein LOC114711581 n=1 Tax=Neltuma alba TaxID=207710 RepID=UPI0010A55E07|nr:uncharacterized protein LOC114711581 [Prosopis alba]
MAPWMDDWMVEDPIRLEGNKTGDNKRRSYQEAISNDSNTDTQGLEEEDGWWYGKGWKLRIKVEQMVKGPNIVLLPEFKRRLAKRQRRSLIVTVFERMVREDILDKKVNQLWGEAETIDIGSGFFMVNYKRTESYDLALTGGPWLIFDHYINVQSWKEDFDPNEEVVTKIARRVGVAKLPLNYYDIGILHVVGSQIGPVLKIDNTTLRKTKGWFARMCIHLDLQNLSSHVS